MNTTPNTAATDHNEYLDQLVTEYTELLIEQTKNLIIFEKQEKFEDCAITIELLNGFGDTLAQTIYDLANVPIEHTQAKLLEVRASIYKSLKETFE